MLAAIQIRILDIPLFSLKILRSKCTKIQFYILFRVNVKHRYLALREYEDTCNQMLRRVFGFERVRVTGSWKKLHNGELLNWYSSSSFSLHGSVSKACCDFRVSPSLSRSSSVSMSVWFRCSACIGVVA
jgi:hypothetical protein